MSPSSLMISPTSSLWPTRTSSYMAAPAMEVAVTTAKNTRRHHYIEFSDDIKKQLIQFWCFKNSVTTQLLLRSDLCTSGLKHWRWPTWSRDAMNISKLALPLLVPNLGQLGHVHLDRLVDTTKGETRSKRRLMTDYWTVGVFKYLSDVSLNRKL